MVLPEVCLRNSLQAIERAVVEFTLFLRNHFVLLSNVQYLGKHCFNFFFSGSIVVLGGKVV